MGSEKAMNALFAMTLVVQSCASLSAPTERLAVDINGNVCTSQSCTYLANKNIPGDAGKVSMDTSGRLCTN